MAGVIGGRVIRRAAQRLREAVRGEVHPRRGTTIRLLDSFLRATCGPKLGGAYVGAVTADRIPARLARRKRFQLVVNTTRSDASPDAPGHFVLVEANRDYVAYIDPFGLPCLQPDLAAFLRRCARPTRHNETTIQHPTSVFCPLYCALFALYYHVSPAWSLAFSRDDLKSNEDRCMRQLNRLLAQLETTPKKSR